MLFPSRCRRDTTLHTSFFVLVAPDTLSPAPVPSPAPLPPSPNRLLRRSPYPLSSYRLNRGNSSVSDLRSVMDGCLGREEAMYWLLLGEEGDAAGGGVWVAPVALAEACGSSMNLDDKDDNGGLDLGRIFFFCALIPNISLDLYVVC
ncbi:hypothetical protein AKJ16_DCAP16375 [Drosera capensis]